MAFIRLAFGVKAMKSVFDSDDNRSKALAKFRSGILTYWLFVRKGFEMFPNIRMTDEIRNQRMKLKVISIFQILGREGGWGVGNKGNHKQIAMTQIK